MVARPARRRGCCAREAELAKVERVDKGINDAHRVVGLYEVVQPIRKERRLAPLYTLNIARHRQSPAPCQRLPDPRLSTQPRPRSLIRIPTRKAALRDVSERRT